ncbi:MAG: TIGR04282 family arsenosugar biosynthesis glycosyltransferase [Alkalilacustris sp.]
MTATVHIFAKAPVPGQVKTRLARSIGNAAACAIYREMLCGVIDRLANRPGWRTWLAVTPDAAASSQAPWPRAIQRVAQGEGDLGARMHRVLSRARPGAPVVIVGSDIPDLDAGHVAEALAALETHDLVVGPALDGGYWLIGAADAPPPDLFAHVRWSSRFALADTLANARTLRVAQLAARLEDVDDADSLARHRARRQP